MIKKLLLTTFILVLLAVNSATTTQAQAKITLRMSWWGSQNRNDRTIKVIDLFKAAHPNVDVTYDFAGFNDYWTKRSTEAAGGNLACLMQQDYAYINDWSARKLIIPLDPYVKDGTINLSDVPDAALSGGRINNQLYGVSLGSNSEVFILDTDAFAKAGMALPPAQWTWFDFEKIVMLLHQKLGIWGMGGGLTDDNLWKALYLSAGQKMFSDDQTQLVYTDDHPLIDFFNMLTRLQDAGAIPTQEEGTTYVGASPEQSAMVTGKSAMESYWSNQVVALSTAAGPSRHFALWEVPRIANKNSANYIKPSMFFSITSQCGSPELEKAAAQFIDMFTNSTDANDILAAERGIPVAGKIRDYLAPKVPPVQAMTFDFLKHAQTDASPIPPPDPAGYGDIHANVYLQLFADPVLYKQLSIDDGVKALRDGVNKVLAKNKKS